MGIRWEDRKHVAHQAPWRAASPAAAVVQPAARGDLRRPTTFRRGGRLADLFEGTPLPAQDRLALDGRAPHLEALTRVHRRIRRHLHIHPPGA